MSEKELESASLLLRVSTALAPFFFRLVLVACCAAALTLSAALTNPQKTDGSSHSALEETISQYLVLNSWHISVYCCPVFYRALHNASLGRFKGFATCQHQQLLRDGLTDFLG